MRVDEIKKENCCGCGTCASGCPKGAVVMKCDEEGFLYPVIDNNRCVNCGICIDFCAFNAIGNTSVDHSDIISLAVRHRDANVIKQSQSGGAFTALSDGALEHSFLIWGMVYHNDAAVCVCASNEEQRNKMRGSKYVQGSISHVFPILENQLTAGKHVLFSGTPCQVAAIKTYIKKKKLPEDYLYTVDLICHGVPSPRFWKDYISHRKKQLHTEKVIVNFRDKSRLGWHSHEESIGTNDCTRKIYSHQYANVFYTHLTLRPSCYNCPFACQNRSGDVTIADCWGIEKMLPLYDDNKGVSLLLVNSMKGQQLLHYAEKEMETLSIDVSNYLQPNMVAPSSKPKKREQFWKEYNKRGFRYVLKKYSGDSWRTSFKRLIGLFENRHLWE